MQAQQEQTAVCSLDPTSAGALDASCLIASQVSPVKLTTTKKKKAHFCKSLKDMLDSELQFGRFSKSSLTDMTDQSIDQWIDRLLKGDFKKG